MHDVYVPLIHVCTPKLLVTVNLDMSKYVAYIITFIYEM